MQKRGRSPSPSSSHFPPTSRYLSADQVSLSSQHPNRLKYTASSSRSKGKGKAFPEDEGGAMRVVDDDEGGWPEPTSPSRSLSPVKSDLEEESESEGGEEVGGGEKGREGKRRTMEGDWEERMKALEADEPAKEDVAEEVLPEEQLELMAKLAQTLAASANPTLLEIRILANHGQDPRFAFLRKGGKWAEDWKEIKQSRMRKARGAEVVGKGSGGEGVGLVAYEDSDEDEEVEEEEPMRPVPGELDSQTQMVDEEEVKRKAVKAEKARLWAEKRMLAREAAAGNSANAIPQ